MPAPSTNRLNFIDLFAGAGGLSCGLELAGLQCLLGVDFNKDAMKTFAANHKNAQTWCGDITQLTAPKLKKILNGRTVHLVVGGPPCQGFSTVGIGNPDDHRNKLFLEFVRIVRLTKPLYILLENVTGLLAKKNEPTLNAIFEQFEKLGYNMNVKALCSEDYGVPERRRRTIILGSRINDNVVFPRPSHNTLVGRQFVPPVSVGEAFKALKAKSKKILNHDLTKASIKNEVDRQRLSYIPEGKGIRYEEDEAVLPPHLRLGVDWKNLRENRFRQCKYQRLDTKKPSPTIMTNGSTYFHPTENRCLTVREGASLQSFPNDFLFEGNVTSQWRQVGNAVPPLMAKALGKAILQMLKDAEKTKRRPVKVSTAIGVERSRAFVY
jgi:DNA (cytosine-5)-methyltransferase 1